MLWSFLEQSLRSDAYGAHFHNCRESTAILPDAKCRLYSKYFTFYFCADDSRRSLTHAFDDKLLSLVLLPVAEPWQPRFRSRTQPGNDHLRRVRKLEKPKEGLGFLG